MKGALAALLVGALIALPWGPLGAATGSATGHLEGGASYTLVKNPSAPTVALGLWFRAPASGYDLNRVGIADLAARTLAEEPLSGGPSLRELVERNGGTLQIEIAPNLMGVSIVVPRALAAQTLHALSEAYFSGTIDAKTLEQARAQTGVRAVEERFNLENDLEEHLFRSLFVSGPLHVAVYPSSAAGLDSVDLKSLQAFVVRAFRPGNASFSLVGDVTDSLLAQISSLGLRGSDASIDSSAGDSGKTVVVHGSSDALALGFVGPPIASREDATALDFVASVLLDRSLGVAGKLPPKSVAAAHFVTLHGAGVFMIFAVGKDRAKMRSTLLADIARLRTPLSSVRFEALRRAFAYHIASSTLLPQSLADNLGWYAAAGDAQYAPGLQDGAYARSVDSLTPERVASAVRRYLVSPTIVEMNSAVKKSA